MTQHLANLGIRGPWDIGMALAFLPGAAFWAVIALMRPDGVGTHGAIYADAAAAWLRGADPWLVGPPSAVYAGPPTMLLPFVPFTFVPWDVARITWFVLDIAVAVWVVRRLGMPGYWLAFPPVFSSIVLGHVELIVLALLVLRGPASGLAAVIKPYAVFPLIAERQWRAVFTAGLAVAITAPLLPWATFFADSQLISATIARQNVGDSVFGQPIAMLLAIISLAILGPRRALWFAVPVLWPSAQPIYKTLTLPVLTPVLAIFWALPFAGATLVGLVVLAALVAIDSRRPLPGWLRKGILPVARIQQGGVEARLGSPLSQPAAA